MWQNGVRIGKTTGYDITIDRGTNPIGITSKYSLRCVKGCDSKEIADCTVSFYGKKLPSNLVKSEPDFFNEEFFKEYKV